MESKRTHSPSNVVVTFSDSQTVSSNSKQSPNNANTNSTRQLSFDPMSSSLAKRRFSQRSFSVSSSVGYDDETTTIERAPICTAGDVEGPLSTTKSSEVTTTQKDGNNNTISANNETKLYAALPDPNKDKVSPDDFLHKLVFATCGMELEPKKAKSLNDFFVKVTDEQVAAYTITVVSACRNNDLDALKKLHSEEGQTMNCFNRFGESLLTMACRRGFEAIVEFLLHQPDVDVRISDDSGRTVLHDACWNPTPQLKICEWIAKRDPALFFIADNRGCTPFQYARPEHWDIWRQFLLDNKESLQALKADDVKSKLWKQPQN